MSSADDVRDLCIKAIRYDVANRDYKRSRLAGLVGGNPPYSREALIEAGRSDECNVNWRIAKYFLTLAKDMLYDTTTEAETLATVILDPYEIGRYIKEHGGANPAAADVAEWSRKVSGCFDRLQKEDKNLDFCDQQSQGQSVFYGCGPLQFFDEFDFRAVSHESKMLIVPELARSNPNYWEWAGIIQEYSPDQLYSRIQDPNAAQARGWNVPETRRAIMFAHPITRTGVTYQSWSWHQDVLKNNSFYYADQSNKIRVVYFYFREFPRDGEDEGKITEVIIELDGWSSQTPDGSKKDKSSGLQFLFRANRKYDDWNQIIHPMYWNHDLNGYHHSVNGLGLEMYAGLEYLNRLYCRQADNAMAPDIFFKPTTASQRQMMGIAQVGRYAIMPAALEMVQSTINPLLGDKMLMAREVQNLVSSNLSQFRSSAMTKTQGNPVTARQVDYEASEQAKMGKSQLARVYEQRDWFYAEKYRRATASEMANNSIRGGKQARQFWKWCENEGVPRWALDKVQQVAATRVVGQGSQYMRQQALERILGLISMLPEVGRNNLVRDVIASQAGQSHVERYMPGAPQLSLQEQEQESEAMLQVAAMKTGVPPIMVSTQNPMIFAGTFIQAAEGSVQALQQGGNPTETASFLSMAIPAADQHLKRMSMDPTRKSQLGEMEDRLKELVKVDTQLNQQLQQQAQAQQQAQQQVQQTQMGQDPETQIGLAKVAAKERVDMAKLSVNARIKAATQQTNFGLKAHQQAGDQMLAARRAGVEGQIKAFTAAGDLAIKHKVAQASVNKPEKDGS